MPDTVTSTIPERIGRGQLDTEIEKFLKENNLRLGGKEPFTDERRHHTQVLAVAPPPELVHVRMEPLVLCGPVGDFNVRCYHPSDKVSGVAQATKERGGTVIHIHGGGWTPGSLPEFDTFFRIMAEEGGV